MLIEILLPKLGLTMEEAEIIEWCKQEGDQVSSGQVLYILETEKTSFEFEAPNDGVLGPILVPEGESIPVGSVVAHLLIPGEEETEVSQVAAPQDIDRRGQGETGLHSFACIEDDPALVLQKPAARERATPLAKKLARENEIALSSIKGSGPSGRILAADLAQAETQKTQSVPFEKKFAVDKLVPRTAMRKTIAKHMLASKLETAQTYMSIDIDASAIVQSRKKLLPKIDTQYGVRLTLTDIFMKVCGNAILSHPIVNTRWTDEGIQYLADVHMGMALALESGLLVPVIRDINKKSLAEIALDRNRLITSCRSKQFSLEDISGSTFSLSTLGAFGIDSFTSNINLPESAILAVGAVKERAVVVNGEILAQAMANITLTYDHRHIDGAEAANFMQTLRSQLEACEGYL